MKIKEKLKKGIISILLVMMLFNFIAPTCSNAMGTPLAGTGTDIFQAICDLMYHFAIAAVIPNINAATMKVYDQHGVWDGIGEIFWELLTDSLNTECDQCTKLNSLSEIGKITKDMQRGTPANGNKSDDSNNDENVYQKVYYTNNSNGVKADYVFDQDSEMETGEFGFPRYIVSPYEIFSGKIPMLNPNYFNSSTSDITQKTILKENIKNWYSTFRIIAIMGLLCVIVYLGIRTVISASITDKVKYKQMMVDWVVALCLIFCLNYIMAFTMNMVDYIVEIIGGISDEEYYNENGGGEYVIQIDNLEAHGGTAYIPGNLISYTRLKSINNTGDNANELMWAMVYGGYVVITIVFIFTYYKRFFTLTFLTFIAPLVALTYPIDKVRDGKAQAFNYWLREYITNATIPIIHIILYRVLLQSVPNLVQESPVYALFAFTFMISGEKIIKSMFGVKGESAPPPDIAGATMAGNMMGRVTQDAGKLFVGEPKKTPKLVPDAGELSTPKPPKPPETPKVPYAGEGEDGKKKHKSNNSSNDSSENTPYSGGSGQSRTKKKTNSGNSGENGTSSSRGETKGNGGRPPFTNDSELEQGNSNNSQNKGSHGGEQRNQSGNSNQQQSTHGGEGSGNSDNGSQGDSSRTDTRYHENETDTDNESNTHYEQNGEVEPDGSENGERNNDINIPNGNGEEDDGSVPNVQQPNTQDEYFPLDTEDANEITLKNKAKTLLNKRWNVPVTKEGKIHALGENLIRNGVKTVLKAGLGGLGALTLGGVKLIESAASGKDLSAIASDTFTAATAGAAVGVSIGNAAGKRADNAIDRAKDDIDYLRYGDDFEKEQKKRKFLNDQEIYRHVRKRELQEMMNSNQGIDPKHLTKKQEKELRKRTLDRQQEYWTYNQAMGGNASLQTLDKCDDLRRGLEQHPHQSGNVGNHEGAVEETERIAKMFKSMNVTTEDLKYEDRREAFGGQIKDWHIKQGKSSEEDAETFTRLELGAFDYFSGLTPTIKRNEDYRMRNHR